MKNQRVLVTGGAGFIGSSLAEELAKDNEVVILDNLSSGRMENIKDILEKDNVKFIKGSINDCKLLKECFKDIDYVFHLAALASVPGSIRDPIASDFVNVNGTLNVLIAARDNHIKKVVNTSSCAIYGDPSVVPVGEAAAVNPKSPYAVTKLAGEYYCSVFGEVYGLSTVSLRYFNVYGPRQDPKSEYAAVIPAFITRVLDDKPPVIYGDGLQTRDFVFIKDILRANILSAESKETGVFNIGSGASVTITGLADRIIALLGKDIEPLYEEKRGGDIRQSFADISKAQAFGYEPEYSLEEGLRESIRWFNKRLA